MLFKVVSFRFAGLHGYVFSFPTVMVVPGGRLVACSWYHRGFNAVQLHAILHANQEPRAWLPSLVLDSSLTHPTLKSDTMHFESETPYPSCAWNE
jgi:hypothetical protein